ncbi:MAG: hypothetical protein ACYDCO_28345 [Armatimonadota bacterium]
MRYISLAALAALVLFILLLAAGCSTSSGQAARSLVVTPDTTSVTPGGTTTFTANMPVHWSVREEGGGTITAAGVYTAPYFANTFHIVATCTSDSTITREATVTVAWD